MRQIVRKIIVPIVLVLFGIIAIVAGSGKMQKIKNYPQTSAVITRIEEEWNAADDSWDHHVFVKYTVDNVAYESELDEYSSSFQEGDEITVGYNAENPREVIGLTQWTLYVFFAVGAVLTLAGVFLLARTVVPLVLSNKKR